MAGQTDRQAAVAGQIRTLFQAGALGNLTDEHLLQRFRTGRREIAESAFAALVERHGPMVWQVCRRVLTDPHQTEDAFQATFLVLVQHARSVRRDSSVASWLYGVAYRVACGSRSAEARRRRHEHRVFPQRGQAASRIDPERAELGSIVLEELNRLSDPYRLAVVLCDLEELTHEQAATRLGWPVGTVKSRLARGREKLRSRLIRRGLAPSLGLAGLGLLGEPALTAAPPALFDSTIQLALGVGAGLSVAGSASTAVPLMTREVSRAMWISRLKWAAIAVVTTGAMGLGVASLWQRTEARQLPEDRARASSPPNRNRNEDAIWARHVGNLKRIGLALHNYQSAEGHFPAAAILGADGRPLLSWRVAILPYLVDYDGQTRADLHKSYRLDEPWDSPHNKALLARMPAVFASPGDGNRSPSSTAYRGFVGPGGKQPPPGPMGGGMMGMMMGRGGGMRAGPGQPATTKAELVEWKQLAERRLRKAEMEGKLAGRGEKPGPKEGEQVKDQAAGGGAGGGMGAMMVAGSDEVATRVQGATVFREGRGVELQEITDGTSNTIMVVEAAEAVPWTKPEEVPFAEGSPLPRLGGSMSDGFAALFVDGRVRLIDRRVDERTLRNLITPNGGEIISTDHFLRPDSPPPGELIVGQDAGASTRSRRMPSRSSPGELIVGQDAGASGALLEEDSPRYAGAGTLQNAVGILKDRLNREGKGELAEWLTEPRARRTIGAGLRAYETYLREIGEPQGPREQFEIVKPLCQQIAREGIWPADCWFSAISGVETRDRIAYDHHQVRLVLESSDRGKPFRFSILVLDVFSGPVDRPSAALKR